MNTQEPVSFFYGGLRFYAWSNGRAVRVDSAVYEDTDIFFRQFPGPWSKEASGFGVVEPTVLAAFLGEHAVAVEREANATYSEGPE